PPAAPLFPYTTLFRSLPFDGRTPATLVIPRMALVKRVDEAPYMVVVGDETSSVEPTAPASPDGRGESARPLDVTPIPSPEMFAEDRKSTRLNSSHRTI